MSGVFTALFGRLLHGCWSWACHVKLAAIYIVYVWTHVLCALYTPCTFDESCILWPSSACSCMSHSILHCRGHATYARTVRQQVSTWNIWLRSASHSANFQVPLEKRKHLHKQAAQPEDAQHNTQMFSCFPSTQWKVVRPVWDLYRVYIDGMNCLLYHWPELPQASFLFLRVKIRLLSRLKYTCLDKRRFLSRQTRFLSRTTRVLWRETRVWKRLYSWQLQPTIFLVAAHANAVTAEC